MDNGVGSYRRFLDGDEEGLAEIIRYQKDGLILFINGIVHNIHTAEELTEEVFVKLVVKRPRFFGKSSFKTWLYAIARNVAYEHLRSRRATAELTDEEMQRMISEEDDLERMYIREEDRRAVHRALGRLNPDYSQVLYLIYFEEMDNSEAAAVMRKSKRQGENLIYRAKSALRSELLKEGFCYEGLY